MKHIRSPLLTFVLVFTLAASVMERPEVAVADEMTSRFVRQSAGRDTVIVFVHGIMGDGLSTWTSQNAAYWPELLTKDQTFDGTDIFVYSYPSSFWSTLSIDELAENMRAVFVVHGIAAYQKIVFLSHSMGGLVTRAYLLKNRDVAARTSFAYFFSTPTTGSQIASIGQFISSNPQISKMKSMKADEYLGDLVRQWLAARFDFPSYCAYEKRPTNNLSLVVSMDSAAALCTRALDPIDTDHYGVVKPDNQNSASYIAFKAAFADARISELKTQLDYKTSVRVQSEIAELVRFPEGPEASAPRTVLETMLVDKLPHRMFGILERYNRADILGVPRNGDILYQYKQDYYDFQSRAKRWEEMLTTKIGERVFVRFTQAWLIYLRYVIMRLGGHTKEEIIAGGNFLNYDITWDDQNGYLGSFRTTPLLPRKRQTYFRP